MIVRWYMALSEFRAAYPLLLLNLNQGRQPHAQGRGHFQPWNNERHGRIQQPTVIQDNNQACVYASKAKHLTRNLRHLELAQL